MGQRGRPTVRIVLSDDERETLERWARRRKAGQALALRCRIVLAAATGATNEAIAKELECNPVTVGTWRTRFAAKRLDGLIDEPRPGQPRKITHEIVEQVIVATLETTLDDGSTQWSTRSMAAKVGLNQTAVSRIWRTFGLKPHRIEDIKLSTDPQFIDKVRDVVGPYLNPHDAAVVLCVDDKTQVQALDRIAAELPMLPGTPARQSYTCVRNGTSDFCAARARMIQGWRQTGLRGSGLAGERTGPGARRGRALWSGPCAGLGLGSAPRASPSLRRARVRVLRRPS